MSTITGTTINTGITLSTSGTVTSPLTITASGAVEATSGRAIYGPATNAWTVLNQGTITAPGEGVLLANGGSVGNTAGLIQGYTGVYIKGGAGTVTNSARIVGTGGTYGVGVHFDAGGTVVNTGTGLIEGAFGVKISGSAGTVTNANTIRGTGTASLGVWLAAGGTVSNASTGLIEAASAVYVQGGGSVINAGMILGTLTFGHGLNYGAAVYIKGGGGSAGVTNSGTIRQLTDIANFGVELHNGGSIVNQTGGLIEAITAIKVGYTTGTTGTVTNAGTIRGTGGVGICFGVYFLEGGTVSNTAGLIEGASGIYIKGGAGAVTNAATIAGTAGFGIIPTPGIGIFIKTSAAAVTNTGTILSTSGTTNFAVKFGAGGSIANNAGLIQGFNGIYITGGAGTVTNSSTIVGTSGNGVFFNTGGRVANNAGLIEGYGGIYIFNAAGTVTNSGTIRGTGTSTADGVFFNAGGSVGNNAGLIEGATGVRIANTTGTVSNAGTIVATGSYGRGVDLFNIAGVNSVGNTGLIKGYAGVYIGGGSAGTVTNSGTIQGTSGTGIDLAAGGTVINSGTVGGGGGTAISFGGTGSNLLVLQNGYQLTGAVVGSIAATDTIKLAGSVGNGVTVTYNALGLSSFEDVLFGAGGYGTLKIGNTSGTFGVTISGFTSASDIIDLTALGTDATITNNDTIAHRVTVSGSGGTVTLQLDATDAQGFNVISDGTAGVELIACFLRGTLILTPDGEVPVEELAIGDAVTTLTGQAQPIRWIGYRAYDGRFIAKNRAVLPIRIAADALDDGVPARDLWLSPEHSLYIDGALVQVAHLVNGATIVQADDIERVEYFHIELDHHSVIFAEGAPAESFVDCDNRMMFANGAEYAALYPDDDRPRWEFCRPRLEWESQALTEIRAALLDRAAALGRPLDLDPDPDLHLIVDGEIVRPVTVAAGVYRFAIPAGSAAVWLASRSTVPAESVADSRDSRRLGVPVERIALSDANLFIEAWHGHAALCDGFHGDEADHRWTDGLARLPETWLCPFPGAYSLDVQLIPSELGYRLDLQTSARAAA